MAPAQHSRPSRAWLRRWCQWWNGRERGGDIIRRMCSSRKIKGASPYVWFSTHKQLTASCNYNVRRDCSYNHSKMDLQPPGSHDFSFSLILVRTSASWITDRDGDRCLCFLARSHAAQRWLLGSLPASAGKTWQRCIKQTSRREVCTSAYTGGLTFCPFVADRCLLSAPFSFISLCNHLIARSLGAEVPHLHFSTNSSSGSSMLWLSSCAFLNNRKMARSLFLSRYLAHSATLFRKGPWRQEKGGRKREEGKHSVFVIKRCFHWGMCALAVDCFLLAAYLQGFWLRAWLELFFPNRERERK